MQAQVAAEVTRVVASNAGLTELEKLLLLAIGTGILAIGSLAGWSVRTAFPQILRALTAIPMAIRSFESSIELRDQKITTRLDNNTTAIKDLSDDVRDLRETIVDRKLNELGEVASQSRAATPPPVDRDRPAISPTEASGPHGPPTRPSGLSVTNPPSGPTRLAHG